jgi:DnaJ-domain-containing protein 1
MIFIIVILVILALLFIFTPKERTERQQNAKRLLFTILGVISFILLIRIVPILIAALSSIFVILIPFLDKFLKIFSTIAIFKGFFRKKTFAKNNNFSNLSVDEACDILGVTHNASKKEINDAFKRKMKQNHPDQQGSEYFTKKLIEAKELLLKQLGDLK